MKINRVLCLLTLIVILAFVSSTPSFAARQQEKIAPIILWHAMPAEYSPIIQEIVNKYIHRNNNLIPVEIRHFSTPAEMHIRLLRGEKPDIALIDTRWEKEINKRNSLVCMEDLILDKVGRSVYIVFKMDTFESMWEASKIDGKLYTLPFTGYNRALIINNDILSKCAVKKTPTVWGELVAAAKQVKKQSPDKSWGFMLPLNEAPEDLAAFFEVFLWQTGKEIYQPVMDGDIAVFNSPEGKAVLKMMVGMVNTTGIAPKESVDKSKVAMFVGTPADYLSLTKQGSKLSVARWPGKLKSVNDMVVYSFAVFPTSDDKKLGNIWHLLYEMCEFESAMKWAMNTPFLPQNKQVTLSPHFFDFAKTYPGIKIFAQQLKNSRSSIRDEKKEEAMKILGENIRRALRQEITIEEALNSSTEKANMILDPNGTLRSQKTAGQ